MKRKEKWFKAGLMVALCGGLYAFQLLRSAPVTITLEEALAKKMVTCKLTSNGNYSGESVAVSLTNLTGSTLRITIPQGTVFKPSDEGDQDLIVVEPQVLALNGKATVNQIADGFCIESGDHAPADSNGMKLSKNTNTKLQELIAFMQGKGYDDGITQDALWAVSDNASASYIGTDTEKDKALRNFVCKLTGQPDPWYTAKQEHTVTPQRVIESNPVSVNGMIQFESDGKVKIHEVVKKTSGEVMNTSEEIEFPQKGKWNYEFTLTVKGWDKGDYVVNVMNGTKMVKSFPFTI